MDYYTTYYKMNLTMQLSVIFFSIFLIQCLSKDQGGVNAFVSPQSSTRRRKTASCCCHSIPSVILLHQSTRSSTDTIVQNQKYGNSTTIFPTVESDTDSIQQQSNQMVFQRIQRVPVMDALASLGFGSAKDNDDVMSSTAATATTAAREYQRGLITIGFITLLFSSNSPVLHAAFSISPATTDVGVIAATSSPPPVLLLNAAVSVVALVGLLLGGDSLESYTPLPSSLENTSKTLEEEDALAIRGGCELGLWKFLGTTANLYGLALTTAGHGALLIQLTTLIVPIVQGIQGVPIPQRIQASVALALAGVVCFTQDPTGTPSAVGDGLCVLAAIFYATYDLRLFTWGKKLPAKRLITTKIATQAMLSVVLLLILGNEESIEYIKQADVTTWSSIIPVVVWSGVAVNAVAPFLQVGGQQAVGPTRCQTIYASQPLWAAILSYTFLGEQIGIQGLIGGSIFLIALFLAATAEAPDPNCGETNCEV
jgi:drug/metabolite transporter (DMT)-like permease